MQKHELQTVIPLKTSNLYFFVLNYTRRACERHKSSLKLKLAHREALHRKLQPLPHVLSSPLSLRQPFSSSPPFRLFFLSSLMARPNNELHFTFPLLSANRDG